MGFSFLPDYRFDKFSDVAPDFLVNIGVKAILLDIDNTLEPYENPLPSIEVKNWLNALEQHGIKAGFVSNNGRERVELFNSELNLPAYYKAGKPFKAKIIALLKILDVDKPQAILMGDQVFTDVLAAKNAGIRSILLPPIKDKTDLLTKFKRLLEKPILKRYDRKNGKS